MALLKVMTKPLSVFVLLAALAAWAAIPAAAQSTVPDMTQFGFPQVTATVNFTPGQATSLTAGDQMVNIPADFMSKPVKFEFLEGDPSFFQPNLASDDANRPILATFAFRVTDTSTGQLVGKFDKPVVWSVTNSQIMAGSEVYNTSPANPPKITSNPSPGTIQGTTLSHPFGGAGVGWLVLGVAGTQTTPGMPTTGAGSIDARTGGLALAVLLAGLVVSGGVVLRLRARRTL
jgi:hypothetical protein